MNGKRKEPMRKCIGCGEMKNKKTLIRVLRTPEETYLLDATGKKNGRGAYICCSSECLKKSMNNKGLERTLKTAIPKEIFIELEKELSNTDI